MKRNPARLEEATYDVVIVGGGIHGACIARDAAMRGLRVALLERGDFGGETSHNSLKLIHGGFRYLQHFDLRRIRESIRERRFWLRMAPHLVRPLKFIIPTYGHGARGREILWAALKTYDALACDRNRGVLPGRRIPAGRLLSKQECLRMIPGVKQQGLTGGVVWYDGQMLDADRILRECVVAAAEAGAEVCNYVGVEKLLGNGRRIDGLQVRDMLSAAELVVKGKIVINAAGPWVGSLLGCGPIPLKAPRLSGLSKGMNLVSRQMFSDYAVGVKSNRPSDAVVGSPERLFFITPWQGRSVIGTTHFRYSGNPDDCEFTEADIQAFINEINEAYPSASLRIDDVSYCYGGLTPEELGSAPQQSRRALHGEIRDHALVDKVEGLISVIGVKYTTARLVGERVVDLTFKKLGKRPPPNTALEVPLAGAREFADLAQLEQAISQDVQLNDPEAIAWLTGLGANYTRTLGARVEGPLDPEALFRARCRYAVKHEMAMRLEDIVLRVSNLASLGLLCSSRLSWCADMMAAELGWTKEYKQVELSASRAALARRAAQPQGQVRQEARAAISL